MGNHLEALRARVYDWKEEGSRTAAFEVMRAHALACHAGPEHRNIANAYVREHLGEAGRILGHPNGPISAASHVAVTLRSKHHLLRVGGQPADPFWLALGKVDWRLVDEALAFHWNNVRHRMPQYCSQAYMVWVSPGIGRGHCLTVDKATVHLTTTLADHLHAPDRDSDEALKSLLRNLRVADKASGGWLDAALRSGNSTSMHGPAFQEAYFILADMIAGMSVQLRS
jgi:hypothetical protein